MTTELPGGGEDGSKAARALREAERSPCPHCGRETPTVSGGVCADCWGIKDPEKAVDFRPQPKTEPLLGWDGLFDWLPGAAWTGAAAIVAIVGALVWVLVR